MKALLEENDGAIEAAGGRVAALGLDSEDEYDSDEDSEEESEEEEEEERGGGRGRVQEEEYNGYGTGPIDVSGASGFNTFVQPVSVGGGGGGGEGSGDRPAFLENLLETHRTKQMVCYYHYYCDFGCDWFYSFLFCSHILPIPAVCRLHN